MLKDFRNLLNGVVYGMTLIIPGISATILAIILGFYDDLIFRINHFRKDYRGNTRVLGVFLAGIACGAVAFSSVIIYLLENFSFPTMLFFIGLMTGITPHVFSKAKGSSKRIKLRETLLAVFSIAALVFLSLGITGETSAELINASNITLMFYILLAGIINGATLVIPGLSGALLLLIMGLYPLVISSISYIGVFLGDMGNVSLLGDISLVLLPFGLGGVIGFLVMARLMEKLMRDFNESAHAVILGLILGSIIMLSYNQLTGIGNISTLSQTAALIMFCAGCAAAYLLGKRSGAQTYAK